MLFAADLLILRVCPAHRSDLILRKVNVDHYDDRILAFIQKHPDKTPFHDEGPRNKISFILNLYGSYSPPLEA